MPKVPPPAIFSVALRFPFCTLQVPRGFDFSSPLGPTQSGAVETGPSAVPTSWGPGACDL